MKQFVINTVGLVLGLSLATACFAEARKVDAQSAEEVIRDALKNFPVQSVEPSPIAGMYEVVIGGQVVYFSGDMKYQFSGDIVDYERSINLTEKTRNTLNAKVFNDMDKGDYLAFKPKDKTEHVINVFTDVDCGYCRKLHSEVPQLNAKGIEVRYFLYPRAGSQSRSARTLESIWCADDQQEAMNRAKTGRSIESKRCNNPVDQHIALGAQVGLRGTPLIFTGRGTRISGYRPAKELHAQLLTEAAEAKLK